MRTYVIMWNPQDSNFEMPQLMASMENCNGQNLCWLVNDKDAMQSNRFYLVRYGQGVSGIIATGCFNVDPCKFGDKYFEENSDDEDDSWIFAPALNKEALYADLLIEYFIPLDNEPTVTLEEMAKILPELDWTGAHPEQLIKDDDAAKLERYWLSFVLNHKLVDNMYKDRSFEESIREIIEFNDCIQEDLTNIRGNAACEICGYDYQRVFGEKCVHSNPFLLYEIPEKTTPENVTDHFHCVCDNCRYQIEDDEDFNEQIEKLGIKKQSL